MKAKTLGLISIFATLVSGCALEGIDSDMCPADPEKLEPGVCGCGVADVDTDGDHYYDCEDECPADANKNSHGVCGCGVSDDDTDGNLIPDCLDVQADLCPDDENKTLPGECGCGVEDVDTDGDGTYDCADACPEDPSKVLVGYCGCGVEDTDANQNKIPDCIEASADLCPEDENKVEPGVCGCGVEDTDTDGDGTADCYDICPEDVNKLHPSVCGCGVADTDSDGDGRPDCMDGCPNDGTKLWAGICGCGISDEDTDGDGVADCMDGCANDPLKTAPGVCGCGVQDSGESLLDNDDDGAINCLDQCPDNPEKIVKGDVECDDNDSDKDGVVDSQDSCPFNPDVTSGRTGIDCYYMEEDGKRIFTIYTAADFKVLEAEVNKITPADRFGMRCDKPGAILCHDSGNSSEYTSCEPLSSDYFGDDETLVQRVYAWSLGSCGGNQACVNAEGATNEADVCTGEPVVPAECRDTGANPPAAVGDCCSTDSADPKYYAGTCSGSSAMLHCEGGVLKEKPCYSGCSVDGGVPVCLESCLGDGVSTGGKPGDCCTDDYVETCNAQGKLTCQNGVVVQAKCIGSCIDATDDDDLLCLEPLTEAEDFRLYVRVMRDIDMSGAVAAKDTDVGCAGIWESIDLYDTHFDGNGKTITFTSGTKACGMTTPLFDEVVSSQIENLYLKYNMRGAASSALSNYLVLSGVTNVHYDADISLGFSILGENAGSGFGAMAKYSAYSVFNNISLKGSSLSYAGKYYGLVAHGELTVIHNAQVLTEDLSCLSGFCAGTLGFFTGGVVRDLTVNIPKVNYSTTEMTAGIMFLLEASLKGYDFKLGSVKQDSMMGGSFAGALYASESSDIIDVKHEVGSMDIMTGGSSFGAVDGSIQNVTSKVGTLKSENNALYGLFSNCYGNAENIQFEADTIESKHGYAYGFGGYLSANMKDVTSTIQTVKSENSNAYGFSESLSGSMSQNITSQVTTVEGDYAYGFSSSLNNTLKKVQSTVDTVKAKSTAYGFVSSLSSSSSGQTSGVYSTVKNLKTEFGTIYGFASYLSGRLSDVKNDITKIESNGSNSIYGLFSSHYGNIDKLEHRIGDIVTNDSPYVYLMFYRIDPNSSSYGFSLKNANIDIGTVVTNGPIYGIGYQFDGYAGAADIVKLRYHADKLISKNSYVYGMFYNARSLELSDATIRIDHMQGTSGVSMIDSMTYYSSSYRNTLTDVAVYANMYVNNTYKQNAYGFIRYHNVYSGSTSYTSQFNRVALSNRILTYSSTDSNGVAISPTVDHKHAHVVASVNYSDYNIVPTNVYWLERDTSAYSYLSGTTDESKFSAYTTSNGLLIANTLNNAHGRTLWNTLHVEEGGKSFYIPWLNDF